ncbi:MAG: hypothetical protein U5L72_16730 [Bacteroidales bacterium]|nr:hypothetical protein [Bacteroidales bacterium]
MPVFLFLLVIISMISCSGSPGKGNEKSAVSAGDDATGDTRPSKRLIEVLAPADNSMLSCADRIVFSVAQAAGQTRVDSVQLWVGGTLRTTLFTLPAAAEIDPAGVPAGSSTP